MRLRRAVRGLAAGGELSDEAAGAPREEDTGHAPLTVHASAVAVGEVGILIFGHSGSGKSSLALSLLALAAEAGRFARLVGDDRIELVGRNCRLLARGHPLIHGMIEQRGRGMLRLAHEPTVVIRLAVDLLPVAELARYPQPAERQVELCGVKLPRLALSSDRSSYDCARLVMTYLQQADTN